MLAETYPALLAPDYDPAVLALAMPKMILAQDALLTSGSYFIGHDADGVAVCAGGWTRETPGTGAVVRDLGHVRHVVARLDRAGTGVGAALMVHIFDDAKAAGMTRLECLSTLTAQGFYARYGFVVDEDIDVPMGPGAVLPSVRMTCQL
jgi:GNAT superfamily N-acetyltransferase